MEVLIILSYYYGNNDRKIRFYRGLYNLGLTYSPLHRPINGLLCLSQFTMARYVKNPRSPIKIRIGAVSLGYYVVKI